MSPLGTVNRPKQGMENQTDEERYDRQVKQGRPCYGVDMKIVNDANDSLPEDGEAFGEHGKSGHDQIPFEEALRIPFCLRLPMARDGGKKVLTPTLPVDGLQLPGPVPRQVFCLQTGLHNLRVKGDEFIRVVPAAGRRRRE